MGFTSFASRASTYKKPIFIVILSTFLSLFSVCLASAREGHSSIHAGLRGGGSSNVLPSREEPEMEIVLGSLKKV